MADDRDWLTVEEVCRVLGVTPRALAQLVAAEALVAARRDDRVVISSNSVQEFLAVSAERSREPPASDDGNGPPVDDAAVDELVESRLIGKFVGAALTGTPGPCPVCGQVKSPAEWVDHLAGHRREETPT